MGLFTKAKDDAVAPVVEDVSLETVVADPAEQLTTANTRLHAALVALDGRLANPADLPFDPAHLADESALKAAISELIEARPGLKKNYVAGDVGQGARGDNKRGADLIELMKMA